MSDKISDRKNEIENRRKTRAKLIESQIFFVDKYFDMLQKVMMICEKNVSEIPEVTKVINQLSKAVTDDMESLDTSDEFIQIQSELKESHTPERIKAYFKR